MEGSVPHASARKRCADLAGSVPLGQISDHAAAKDLVAIQQVLLRAMPGRAGALPASSARYCPSGPVWRAISRHTTEGLRPMMWAIRAWDKPAFTPRHDRRAILDSKHPTTPHDQPPNSITAT